MMDVKQLHTVDTKLKLLAGLPIELDGIGVLKPFTLREIAEIGYSVYAQKLQTLIVDVNRALGDKADELNVELTSFDLFTHFGDEEYKETFLSSIKYFFREEKVLPAKTPIENNELADIIILGVENIEELDPTAQPRVIHRENFPLVIEALKLQNGLSQIRYEREYSAKDKNAKAILEKIKKAKQKVKEIKARESGSGDNDIDISDIISAVSSKSNSVSNMAIWDLTLYQLYDHFKRLEAINQYEVNIQAIMNGAEDIELKHWSGKLDRDED